MKIGIEAQRLFRPDKHGMDFVILEVLRQLQQEEDDNEYFVFVAPGLDPCLHNTKRMHIIELHSPTYPIWEQWALPRAVKKTRVELLHCTSNTAPLHSPVPIILTLHDIIYLTSAKGKGMSLYQQLGWYYRRWNVPRILNRCRHIITVSDTERTRILDYFPKVVPQLSVVHNGCSDRYHPLTEKETFAVTRKYLPDPRYLLFFGSTDPRKNTAGVLCAYKYYLNLSTCPLKLVITGLKREYTERLLSEMDIEVCAPYIVYTSYVPSIDLPALYNGASTFLFPSLTEGFGIPIIEAMACGTPVITSNCSSMPEVAGEGALLVNPQKPQEIADTLIRLEKDVALRQQQKNYGLDRAKHFSWEKTAKEYLKIYRENHNL